MAERPFALISVNCDHDPAKTKASVEKYQIDWPTFQDGRDGPISVLWHVRSWPNIWLIDSRGVIRGRGLRGRELTEAVNTLLNSL